VPPRHEVIVNPESAVGVASEDVFAFGKLDLSLLEHQTEA
jgi:hypothetical protein